MDRLVKEKILESNKIFKLIFEYYDKLKPLLEDANFNIAQRLEITLSDIKLHYKDLLEFTDTIIDIIYDKKKIISNDHIINLFKYYNDYISYFDNIKNILSKFNLPELSSENIDASNLSQTYKMETADLLIIILSEYYSYIKKYEYIDTKLIEDISIIVIPYIQKNMQQYIKDIQTYFIKYEKSINLYTHILQILLDQSFENKEMKDFTLIINMIEKDKDYFITRNYKNKLNSKDLHLSNPPLKKFNMIPVSKIMTFDEICKKLFDIKINADNIDKNITEYCNKNNICIIILNHVTFDPVVYDINNLMSTSEKQLPNIGINKKIIEKYKNIITFNDKHDYDISYKIYGSTDYNMYYIIEKIANDSYRILSTYLNFETFMLPKNKIVHLLEYFNNENRPNRISCYHKELIKNSSKNMFLPRILKLEDIEERSENIDIQIIKMDIYFKVFNYIKNIIDTKYDKGGNINSSIDINNIIHDKMIKDIITNAILSLYKNSQKMHEISTFSGGQFPFNEVLASFLTEISIITRKFIKNLHDEYNRNKIDKSIFSLPKDKKINMINTKIEEMINNSINAIIDNKENIYSIIKFKYLILNF